MFADSPRGAYNDAHEDRWGFQSILSSAGATVSFKLEELCPDAPCSQQARHKGFALNMLSQAPASAEKKKY